MKKELWTLAAVFAVFTLLFVACPVPEGEPAKDPVVHGVSISGGDAVPKGGSADFTAEVHGTNLSESDKTVAWSLEGAVANDTKITGGKLEIAAAETAETITIVAKSVKDPTKFDKKEVEVSDLDKLWKVDFDPDGGTFSGGATTYHIYVIKGGKIKADEAPLAAKAGYTFSHWSLNGVTWNFSSNTVTANIVLKASWTVNSVPGAVVSNVIIYGGDYGASPGETGIQFTASVQGSNLSAGDKGVTWSLEGNYAPGTKINPAGPDTAKLDVGANEASVTITILAKSDKDTAKVGKRTIVVNYDTTGMHLRKYTIDLQAHGGFKNRPDLGWPDNYWHIGSASTAQPNEVIGAKYPTSWTAFFKLSELEGYIRFYFNAKTALNTGIERGYFGFGEPGGAGWPVFWGRASAPNFYEGYTPANAAGIPAGDFYVDLDFAAIIAGGNWVPWDRFCVRLFDNNVELKGIDLFIMEEGSSVDLTDPNYFNPDGSFKFKPDPYATQWDKPYSMNAYSSLEETADYFDKLMTALKTGSVTIGSTTHNLPTAYGNDIILVPVSHVAADLDRQLRLTPMDGYINIVHACYSDVAHANKYGSFMTAAVFYAVIFGKDPALLDETVYGIPVNERPTLVAAIKETAARVVIQMSAYTGRTALNSTDNTSQRVFLMGNSLTDGIRYSDLNTMVRKASSNAQGMPAARQVELGAPLNHFQDKPQAGFLDSNDGVTYGGWGTALKNWTWNWVSFQPYDRDLIQGDGNGDYAMIKFFIDFVRTNQPTANTKFIVYGRWGKVRTGGRFNFGDGNGYDRPGQPGFNPVIYDAWVKAGYGN